MSKSTVQFPLPLPETDDMSPEQRQKINTFVQTVMDPMIDTRLSFLEARSKNPDTPEPPLDTMALDCHTTMAPENKTCVAYKFLTARKWDMKHATHMFRETCKFRHEKHLGEGSLFPSAMPTRGYDDDALRAHLHMPQPRERDSIDVVYSHVLPLYPTTYHKWDKWGHPIYIEVLGRLNPKKMVEKFEHLCRPGEDPSVPASQLHIHQIEVGMALSRYQDETWGKAHNRRVLGVVVIIDCKNLGLWQLHTPMLDIAKVVLKHDQLYYPEVLHALYAVNCPGMIVFAWNIVKGWLDERIRNKVHFIGPDDTAAALLQVVDAEHLPEHFGGKCRCQGGCIHGLDGTAEAPIDDPAAVSNEIVIASGKHYVVETKVNAGDVVVWEFAVKDNRHVEFSAIFTSDAEEEVRDVYLSTKVVHMSERFESPEKGTLLFTFDNAHSWIHSKTLSLRLYVLPHTVAP